MGVNIILQADFVRLS